VAIQQGLTITASPRTGLVDGRAVTAHGEGWPAGIEVAVAQCAADRFPARQNDCDVNRSVLVRADARGTWDVRIYVIRMLGVSGRSVDCAATRCTLTAAAVVDGVPVTRSPTAGAPDYLAVGEVELVFDPSAQPFPTQPPIVPQPVTFDLDGDSRPDQLWMEGVSGQAQLVARLATGAESRLRSFGDRAQVIARRLDGSPLIFYGFGGNSASTARFATFADGKLREPMSDDPDHEETNVAWNLGAMCCPEGTEDTACLVLDGRETLVRTNSRLIHPDGTPVEATVYRNDGNYQRRWTRTAFVIDGARLVTVRNDSGVIARGAPAPPGVPLDNAFAC
jgi:hypothetical protein